MDGEGVPGYLIFSKKGYRPKAEPVSLKGSYGKTVPIQVNTRLKKK
jgi:hypothetical protein